MYFTTSRRTCNCYIKMPIKCPHHQKPQRVTEPSGRMSYTVGDLCRHLKKLTGPPHYMKCSNPIPPTAGSNGFL